MLSKSPGWFTSSKIASKVSILYCILHSSMFILIGETGYDDDVEPFRFSKSPSLTPARGMTPNFNVHSPTGPDEAGSAAQGAPKTLSKNPMGVYRWQGGGSARPRNRYRSPNFGSKPAQNIIKLQPEKPKADNKRRRVGEEATTSSPQRAGATATTPRVNGVVSSGSASASAPATHNGSASVNGTTMNGRASGAPPPTTPARPSVRTNSVKPTTPAVPSPLRQTWSQSDSSPQPSPPLGKPTRAAAFMTELIKEVTPPKKPAFVNPYEAANPMIKPAPKKQPARKTRAAAKLIEQGKEPELTPQAIIEATVPKVHAHIPTISHIELIINIYWTGKQTVAASAGARWRQVTTEESHVSRAIWGSAEHEA